MNKVNLQGEDAIRNDVHHDRLGEDIGGFLRLLLRGLSAGDNLALQVILRRYAGRCLTASVVWQSLSPARDLGHIGVGRIGKGVVSGEVTIAEKALLLRLRGADSRGPAEQGSDPVTNLTAAILLALLAKMGLFQKEDADNDTEQNGRSAEEVGQEIWVAVPD